MGEHSPRIRHFLHQDEEPWLFIREGVNITFYMRQPHQELGQAVLHALEVYLQTIGAQRLGGYADPEGDWRPLDATEWASIRQELLSPGGARLSLVSPPGDLTGYEFAYQGFSLEEPLSESGHGEVCAASFWLPCEYLEAQGPERVRALAMELAGLLPFTSGHAGLALLFPEGLLGTTEALREECLRYPGLDIPGFSSAVLSLGTRIKGVHWLNFLGPPTWNALGGERGLSARLHQAGTAAQELGSGRGVVSLGPWPEAGDLAVGRSLPAHRELARLLEPWLYEERFDWGGFSREDMRRWVRRFLD